MRATLIAAVAVAAAGTAFLQPAWSQSLRVNAVRTWSLEGVTRVVIQVSGDFEYHADRLANPDRIFFDVFRARPSFDGRRTFATEVGDRFVARVRAAETLPGVTRVVLDLASPVDFSATKLSNPSRLVVELRPAAPQPATAAPTAPALTSPAPAAPAPGSATPPAPEPTAAPAPAAKPAAPPPPAATAATRTSDGKSSLIRALGLKLQRIALDPGHGGHDQGTVGSRGLVEKDLVLDIAQRLGRLLEQEIGCEVIYTRTDDTYVPLEARTALANEKKADLFISLHANSSRSAGIAGVETFYLNFTDSRDALDVAARENASSEKNISELQSLLQKIARQDKIDESRELAKLVQASLHSATVKYNRASRNRGVKAAPFIVLIGAQMPSVLAEIGFLSNFREENLLKRPEHRQRVAEALLRGISRYAQSLSHFQVAEAGKVE